MSPADRLGFSAQDDRTQDDIVRFAQWVFLQHIARLVPEVLSTLHAVPPARAAGVELDEPDPAALTAWAVNWNLVARRRAHEAHDEWPIAHAFSTWRHARRLGLQTAYWFDRDDLAGCLHRPRPGRRAARPLKDPVHFAWAVRYQVSGALVADIRRDHVASLPAQAPRKGKRDGKIDIDAVRKAVHATLELVALTPRPSHPRKHAQSGT